MRTFFPIFFVALVGAIPISSSLAQNWKTAKYDTVWLPVTTLEVKDQLKKDQKDVVGAYQLWRRFSYQGKSRDYIVALQQLLQEQPTNGRWLALRCAAIEESIISGDTTLFAALDDTERRYETRRVNLDKAEKMIPKLWLNLITESKLIVWKSGDGGVPVLRQQVAFSRKAVALAPDLSFTRKNLAGNLSNLAFYSKTSDAEAVREYNKAQTLEPRIFAPALGLAFHYQYNSPNPVGRRKAIQQVLLTIPPGVKLLAPLRRVLVNAGIPVPKGQ